MNIYLYEDSKYKNFYPISYLRPVFHMRSGILSLFEKCQNLFPDTYIGFVVRDQLSQLIARQFPENPVNIIKKGNNGILFLNGRIKNIGDLFDNIKESSKSCIFINNKNEVIGALFRCGSIETVPSVATYKEYANHFKTSLDNFDKIEVSVELYNYNWDIMADISKQIKFDYFSFAQLRKKSNPVIAAQAALINKDDIYIGEGSIINPASVIDATNGPVFIGDKVIVEAHAAIYGPCFIGSNSQVLAGKISHSSIGPTCRVGGEVEESVFHSYVNKYHDGFIGHSYVGSWVNFGAMTTNSDLKNNYSNIRTVLNDENIDSQSNKVGSFIGDHTKFGIGTLLNTGINIGACCNIFGGNLVLDKEIKSFSWGSTGAYQKYQFEKAIETVKIVQGRRSVPYLKEEETLLKIISEHKLSSDGILDFEL